MSTLRSLTWKTHALLSVMCPLILVFPPFAVRGLGPADWPTELLLSRGTFVAAWLVGMYSLGLDEREIIAGMNGDLILTLVGVTYTDPVLRELTTSPSHQVAVGNRTLQYNNTNRLVHNPSWEIGIQKTGYISEAGQCLVMQARIAGRKLILVFLDSAGKLSRLGDAERVRRWVEALPAVVKTGTASGLGVNG